jgi:hypothetical protein
MLSKTIVRASALAAILGTSCSAVLPWTHSPEGAANEINISFTLENNRIFLRTVAINHRTGRVFFGSAVPMTIIDRRLVEELGRTRHGYLLTVNEHESFPFTPLFLDLGSAGDAIVGWEVFQPNAVTVDYRNGLLTLQKEGIYTSLMSVYRFSGEPAVEVELNGRRVSAVVDTSLPDTMVIPGKTTGRASAHVVIAGSDFGDIDVHVGGVEQPRIGNRLLSKFLISIDYRAHQIGVWRDPRIP